VEQRAPCRTIMCRRCPGQRGGEGRTGERKSESRGREEGAHGRKRTVSTSTNFEIQDSREPWWDLAALLRKDPETLAREVAVERECGIDRSVAHQLEADVVHE